MVYWLAIHFLRYSQTSVFYSSLERSGKLMFLHFSHTCITRVKLTNCASCSLLHTVWNSGSIVQFFCLVSALAASGPLGDESRVRSWSGDVSKSHITWVSKVTGIQLESDIKCLLTSYKGVPRHRNGTWPQLHNPLHPYMMCHWCILSLPDLQW